MRKKVQRGKGKRLKRTVITKNTLTRSGIKSALEIDRLESFLSRWQEVAESILKNHNKPYKYPEYFDLRGSDSEEDYRVSYAADILFDIHHLWRWIEIGNAKETALEAINLGMRIGHFEAEMLYEGKKENISGASRKSRQGKAKDRRDKLILFTNKIGYYKVKSITRKQARYIRDEFRKAYPKYKTSPRTETLNKDLELIEFKLLPN